jgi:uncharacterized protein
MLLPRLMRNSLLALLLMLSAALQAQAQQLVAVPALSGHVVDQAGMLDAGQRQRLDAVLADYDAKSGSQIAVLIVKSTEPEVIEQYSIRVADAWKLGRKGIDDGVLLVVATENSKANRRLRIEAGRGVQGVLTDAQSKRVLQDVIAPHFRQNDYYGGLVAGTTAIASLLDKEKFAPPKAKKAAAADDSTESWVFILLIIGAGLWLLSSSFGRNRGGAQLSRGGWGSGASGFIVGSILSNIANSGSRGGGYSGGGGSSGGGFSGGGGSFDGGGASGDW